MILSSVLLPHPLGPIRLTTSPAFAYRFTSWSTANGCPCWSISLLTASTRTLASPRTSAGASEATRFTALLTRAAQNEKPPCLDGFVSSSSWCPSARLTQVLPAHVRYFLLANLAEAPLSVNGDSVVCMVAFWSVLVYS